jgi:hypothetical protein
MPGTALSASPPRTSSGALLRSALAITAPLTPGVARGDLEAAWRAAIEPRAVLGLREIGTPARRGN